MKKNIVAVGVIAAAILVVGIYGFVKGDGSNGLPVSSDEPSLGGMVETVEQWFSKGFRLGTGNTATSYNSFEGTIKGTANQAFVRNTTGKTIYVRTPFIAMISNVNGTGSASSTFIALMATSTMATLTSDYTTPVGQFLASTIATGTIVHSLSSITAASTSPVIAVPDGAYVNIQLQSRYACGTANKSAMNTHACDTATSTNRGFDLYYQIPVSYSPN